MGSIVEICPALILDPQSKQAAADYCMHIEAYGTIAPPLDILALGCGALYNHQSNVSGRCVADWCYDHSLGMVAIVSQGNIPNGSEIFINYGENYWKARTVKE